MKLTKRFRFESAHRLVKGYSGKCQHLHGHSWNGYIECESDQLSSTDMVIDFSDMGQFVKDIESDFDHATIVADDDASLMSFLREHSSRYVQVAGNATCERIAMTIYERAVAFFKPKEWVNVTAVVIEETCTTSCRYEGEEMRVR